MDEVRGDELGKEAGDDIEEEDGAFGDGRAYKIEGGGDFEENIVSVLSLTTMVWRPTNDHIEDVIDEPCLTTPG